MPDLLDRLLGHDTWTTARLLALCEPLTDEQLDHDFDLGHRTVRKTFVHLIGNMESWSELMSASTFHAPAPRLQGNSIPQLTARLHRAAADLAKLARAIADRGGWDECFVDTFDNPPKEKTYGGGIAHIFTHSMHHRAQLLYMLRRLGVESLPEGDVLSWEHQNA